MKLQAFYNELQKIIASLPQAPATILSSENCEYGNMNFRSKNLMFCFDCVNCNESTFLYDSYLVTNSVDCDYCVESELCYESVDAVKCFNSAYLEYCTSTHDSQYSSNCINCHDVFGCVNLQNKSFCIFNRQLSEEEYRQKVAQYKQWSPDKILTYVESLKLKYPVTQTIEAHNENSSYGNYVHYSKNCYLCFDAGHNEDCAYLYDSFYNKMCYDMTYAGQNNQQSYELVDTGDSFNCLYSVFCGDCRDSAFIFNCSNLKDCLGCVGLTNKQYCILNRQFTKEDYERIKRDIFMQLAQEKTGWGNIRFTT